MRSTALNTYSREESREVRQSEKDLISEYLYNNYVRLEEHCQTLQNNLRFRRIDMVDCIELACALQEFETFKEISGHIRVLLKLTESE